MAYLTINRKADSGLYVVESMRQNKNIVHDNVTQDWARKRPGEPAPDIAGQLTFMADDLEESQTEMVSSLEFYLNESTVNTDFTQERDEAVREMSYWYQFTRDISVDFCGESRTRRMGFAWAGLDEEARRIKPSTRRPGLRAVLADEDSESPDSPDGGGEGDASATPDSDQP